MTVKFLKSIPFATCKSNFLSKLDSVDLLPQRKEFDEFTRVNDIKHVHTLIVNNQYCSLDELKNKIVQAAQCADCYLYMSVNKFYVYSTIDTGKFTPVNDYDLSLINFCCEVLASQYTLVKYTIRPDDHGTLGNFIHPVTTMFFKKI
jgi:hypothetical protein